MTAENGIHEEITEITSSHTDAAPQGKHVRGKRLAIGLGVFFLLAALAAVAVVLVCKCSTIQVPKWVFNV